MTYNFITTPDTLQCTHGQERLSIQAWGLNSLRVRATHNGRFADLEWALLPQAASSPTIQINPDGSSIQNGSMIGSVDPQGRISFRDARNGKIVLEELPRFLPDNMHVAARQFRSMGGDLYRISASFQAYPGEQIFGLGQHQNGLLDQKGTVIDLLQINTRIAIPFLLSSRGYGFLWNNPAIGRVELGADATRWVAEQTRQLDYWITLGDTPAEILNNYARSTGYAPMLPEWAAGFWQCKLRYASQSELLTVAREYKKRGLPLSVIVIDGLHWTLMGDWRFNPPEWPDPTEMVQELEKMGVMLMVSIWPMVNINSSSFTEMQERGLLVQTERGVAAHTLMVDGQPPTKTYLHLYDPSHAGGPSLRVGKGARWISPSWNKGFLA